jgi:NodT family efflux transporter outer membrane factor (OMF) lipoprotein
MLRPLTVAAVVAMLSGCYSYRVERVENPIKLPTAWDAGITANASQGVASEWWKGFSSPVLEKLIEDAQRNNPGIIGTEERLKQAERTFSGNRDSLFPELNLSTGLSTSFTGGNGDPPGGPNETTRSSTNALSLSTSYTVDLWGATAARYRANLANFIGTRFDAELARITLSANVARSYFNLLQVRSGVAVLRENLAIAERLLRIVQARYDNDLVRQFDLTQQQIAVQQQRNQLIPRENAMRQAETALGLLLGVTPQEFHLLGEPIDQLTVPEIAPWQPSELLLRRPDLAGAELDMATARGNVAIARANLIPVSLSLSASATQSGTNELFSLTDARNFSLSGALRIAEGIFSHRSKKNAVLNAKSNEYIALINYAQTIRTALKEVDDAMAAVVAAQLNEENQLRTLAQSRRSLELVELEYREGSANLQEVLSAQQSLFSTQDSVSSARISRLTAALTLYVALGGGWTAPETLSATASR